MALVAFGMLSVGTLPAMMSSSIWALLHLTFVAGSIGVLITRADTDGHGNVLRVAVLPLLFCYLRTEFVTSLQLLPELALGTLPVILLAGIAVRCLVGRDKRAGGRHRILPAVIVLLASVTTLSWALAYAPGSVSGPQKGAWVPLVEVLLLAVASYTLFEPSPGKRVRVMGGIGVAPLIVGTVIGWWMMGSAYGQFRTAKTLFADGDVDAAKVQVAVLREEYGFLKFQPLAPSVWIRDVMDELGDRGTVQLWTSLAEMAIVERAWGEASAAYQKGFSLAPSDVGLRIRSVQCLFDEGHRKQALAALHALSQRVKGNAPVQMAKAMAFARMGEVARANEIIDEVIDAGWGINEEILQAIEPGAMRRTTIGELLPAGVDLYTSGVTLYDVVAVLRARGMTVLYPHMVVGSTGIQTPLTVRILLRPPDDPARELIVAGAEDISMHKRGCSLIDVDPKTGAVESRLLRSFSGREVARFLGRVPDGHIVAGSIDDVGPTFFKKDARRALERVGIGTMPDPSWAYAFVGVQGSESGSALHAVGESAVVSLGILAGTIENGASPAEIEAAVRTAARASKEGVGLYVSGIERDSEVVLARAGR